MVNDRCRGGQNAVDVVLPICLATRRCQVGTFVIEQKGKS